MITLRAEIWKIVDEADRKGKFVNSLLIRGALTRDVAKASFAAELSNMVAAKNVKKRRPPKGVFPRRCYIYKRRAAGRRGSSCAGARKAVRSRAVA